MLADYSFLVIADVETFRLWCAFPALEIVETCVCIILLSSYLLNARAAIVEVLQLVEGSIGLARVVVIESRVPPAVCHTLVAVVLWPPPEESLHAAVAVQFGNQVGSKLALTFFSIRIGACIIVFAAYAPRIAVARLYYPDVLAVVFVLQRCQGGLQRGQIAVMLRIVAQSDDVIIDGSILHAVEEVCQHGRLGCALAVDDDFRVSSRLMKRVQLAAGELV